MARRHPHLSRTTFALLAAVLLWVAALVALGRLLDHAAVRAFLARDISGRLAAALHEPVAVGDARVSIAPPRLILLDVRVGPPDAAVLACEVVEVAVGKVRLADREVVLNHVRLRGVRVGAFTPRDASAGGGLMRVVVRQLEVTDLSIERLELPEGLTIAAQGMEVRWSSSPRRSATTAQLSAERFRLSVPGLTPLEGAIDAWGGRSEEGWELRRLRGEGAGWNLDATGSLVGARVAGKGRLGLDLAMLDRFLDAGAGLAGQVDAQLRLAVGEGDFRVEVAMTGREVTVAGFVLSDVAAEGHISPEGVDATMLRASYGGGELEGSYSLTGLGPPWRHQAALRGTDVTVAGFLSTLGVDAAGLSARCKVNTDVTWEGERIGEGSGTGIADLVGDGGELPAVGRVIVTLSRTAALAVSSQGLTVSGAPVEWRGTLSLGSWVPNWSVKGERVRVATVARLLRGWIGTDVLPSDLGGEAAFDLRLRGPFTDMTVVGDVAVAPVSFGAVEANGLEGSLRVTATKLEMEGGSLVIGDGRVAFAGELRFSAGNPLSLSLRGTSVPLARMAGWGGINAPIGGTMAFAGSVGGTLESPTAEAACTVAGASVAGVTLGDGHGELALGEGRVQLRGLEIGPLAAQVDVDVRNRHAEVDAELSGLAIQGLSSPLAALLGGALDCRVRGSFPFDEPTGRLELTSAQGGRGWAELDREGLRLDVALPGVWKLAGRLTRQGPAFAGRFDFGVESWRSLGRQFGSEALPIDGSVVGSANVEVGAGRAPVVRGVIEQAAVVVEGERVEIEAPATFTLEGGVFTLARTTWTGPSSKLVVQARRDGDGRLDGRVEGEFPAALLDLVWREARPRGRVVVALDLGGTESQPRLRGSAEVRDGSLILTDLPGPLTHIAGTLTVVPTAIGLEDVTFSFLGGTGSCSGEVTIEPDYALDLAVRLRSVRWPLQPGLVPVLTGDVRVVGPLEALTLSGATTLEPTVYRQQLSLEKLVLDALLAPVRAVAPEAEPIALNLDVDVPGTLEMNTPLARLFVRGQLRITGSTAKPGVLGVLEVLPGGELELANSRFEIDRANVTFSDADTIRPVLDLLARGTVQQWEVNLGLVGTLDRLTPTLSSNPPLPESDILALISLGSRPTDSTEKDTRSLASTLLANQLTGAMTSRARTLLNLDQLVVDPFAVTESGSPTARMTAAKQLSPDWTVTVSTNLNSNREEVIYSRWRLAQGVYLEAARESDGSYSMEVRWQRRY